MKVFLGIVFAAVLANAQTNEFFFSELETVQGTYSNATITTHTATYAFVRHETGMAKVWLTNFPVAIQRQLGYDPETAAKVMQAEAARRTQALAIAAERKKYMDSLRGPVQPVRLLAVLDNFGQCSMSSSNGTGRAYMMDIPATAKSALLDYQKLKEYIAQESVRVKNLQRSAERASANAATGAGGDAAYVEAAMAERRRANTLVLDANSAAADLAEVKTRFDTMEAALPEATTFNAFNTGLQDNAIPRWQAVAY